MGKIKRNDKCPCESKKKFKKCHWGTSLGDAIQGNYGQDYLDYILNLMIKEKKNEVKM